MKSPILQLDDYFLTRLQIDYTFPREGVVTQADSVTSIFDYDLGHHREEPRRRMMRLKVDFQELDQKQEKIGYTIQCEITGFFSFTDSTPKDKEELVLRVNGFALLYGALRGVLATTTAVCPGGRFSVPNVMPNEIVADIERRRQESAKNASQAASENPAAAAKAPPTES
jgi:hypothetical protein